MVLCICTVLGLSLGLYAMAGDAKAAEPAVGYTAVASVTITDCDIGGYYGIKIHSGNVTVSGGMVYGKYGMACDVSTVFVNGGTVEGMTYGTYVYTKLASYSANTYANSQLKNSTDTKQYLG